MAMNGLQVTRYDKWWYDKWLVEAKEEAKKATAVAEAREWEFLYAKVPTEWLYERSLEAKEAKVKAEKTLAAAEAANAVQEAKQTLPQAGAEAWDVVQEAHSNSWTHRKAKVGYARIVREWEMRGTESTEDKKALYSVGKL